MRATLPWVASLALGACGGTPAVPASSPASDTFSVDFVLIAPDSAPDAVAAIDAPTVSTGADFGKPCQGNTDCASSFCISTAAGPRCTVTCTDSCPADFACRQGTQSGLDPVFLCLPAHAPSCQPCADDVECYGGRCEVIGDEGQRFCLATCAKDESCPAGTACAFGLNGAAVGMKRCLPTTGSCTCTSATAGALRPCQRANQSGTCLGVETCDAGAGWAGCTATPPAPETCNGKDDDCTGSADDGLPATKPCVASNDHGTCHGDAACQGALGWVCGAPAPEAEVCNGQDDDCDGTPDDVAIAPPCAMTLGVCAGATQACGGVTGWTACSDATYLAHAASYESVETHCNALDDDCDGETDEALPPIACPLTLGVCAGAMRACVGGQFAACDYGGTFEPLELSCDGLDNDCNGFTDDVDADGDGVVTLACPGGSDCDDSDKLVSPDAAETFDTKDTDCDGLVDEGFIAPGTVIVTELHLAPKAVPAEQGQWLELTNLGAVPINLASFEVVLGDGAPTQLPASPPILVAPGTAAVLCRTLDPKKNGGVSCHGVLGGPLPPLPTTVSLRLGGVVIDLLPLTAAAQFPTQPVSGASLALDPNQYTPAGHLHGGHWCATPPAFLLSAGDRGTPGQPNPSCSGPPTIESIAPSSGLDDGGDVVIFTGTGFTGADGVLFGAASGLDLVVLSDTSIRCVTPPGDSGDVTVVVSKGGAKGTAPAGFRYTGETPKAIDWCNLQFPVSLTAAPGGVSGKAYGRVHSPGLTSLAGAPAGLTGALGFGPLGSDPRSTPGWSWFPATWNAVCGGEPCGPNDEFVGSVLAGPQPGAFAFAYRFTDDGGVNFLYCDQNPGTADGFSPAKLGTLTVK